MKNLLFVIIFVLFLTLFETSCSYKTYSSFTVDSVTADNLKIEKKDSVNFKPF